MEEDNEPVFLTKNGYGAMVVMSMERYSEYENEVEIQRVFYNGRNMNKLI